ncbi:MAG: Holliday junction resolvase RuvX [Acidimicrobiia bacterium]|nr:Holliday junction resolvase RuvX [Acidimicrobiia bacterium]
MTERRLIGLDMGRRRVGIAVSAGRMAVARATVDRDDALPFLAELCVEIDAEWLVVGLPVSLDGVERESAAEARRFGAEVAEATGRTVVFWDERFTSVIAIRQLGSAGTTGAKRKAVTDQVAAAIVLQSYLDGQPS